MRNDSPFPARSRCCEASPDVACCSRRASPASRDRHRDCPALFSPALRELFPSPSRGRAAARARADATVASHRAARARRARGVPYPDLPRSRGSGPVSDAAPSRSHRRRPPSSRLTERVFPHRVIRRAPSVIRSLQIRRGALEEEAERCAPLPPARARVGVPPAPLRGARDAPLAPGQARAASGTRRSRAFASTAARVRRGGRKRPVNKGIRYGKPVHQGVKKLKFARNLRDRSRRSAPRCCARAPRAQLVLAQRRFRVQVLRGDHGGPHAQGCAQRPAHQLDLQPRAQAPRNPRPHCRRPQEHRGLGGKGHNYNKARPSKRGTWKRNQKISLKRYR